jgi:hypothetical protein
MQGSQPDTRIKYLMELYGFGRSVIIMSPMTLLLSLPMFSVLLLLLLLLLLLYTRVGTVIGH